MNLALDENSQYLGFFFTGSNPVYSIDKKSGEISGKILLRSTENECKYFYRFDAL